MPSKHPLTFALPVAVALVTLATPACHRPQGALMARTGSSQTYASYETLPKTVKITDLRNGEVVFAMDIPVGKQLSLDFLDGEGADPVYAPDLMRYQVFDYGTTTGKLRSMLSVPAASSRRIEVTIRPAPEYAAAASDRVLRTDETGNRPDWWTAEGGELPDDPKGVKNYDD
ncbi:MAG: hypothetical protein GY715_11700 [Planctomycetes bacterium]|nr:hypothetical protein [Planctomycetota bacterium]